MKNPSKTILVTGATGRQGGAVIQHLLKNNLTVKALFKNTRQHFSTTIDVKGCHRR
jgi:uncharacterized protein YbjT (DUF2867 family)